jgi:uncharacterized protein (DUF4415 family)
MTANKPSTATVWTDPDDAPDLSTPEYQAKFAATPVRRGRPKSESPKVRIGLRLSTDLVERLRALKGYNRIVEKALRKEFAMAMVGTSEIVSNQKPVIKRRRRSSTKAKKSASTGKQQA